MSRLRSFFVLIRFEHSVFALPFAYLGLLLGNKNWPGFPVFFWVTVAMVALRTAGMSWNRLVDEPLDALNSRTRYRLGLITEVSRPVIWAGTVFGLLMFVAASYFLNPLCFYLSPVPVVLIMIYPYLKKFTWCSHFFLGMILGIAPIGAWLAGTGVWSWQPVLLFAAVWAWVSGFDLLYALQDMDSDRELGLKSFPSRFGFFKTVNLSVVLHGAAIVCLALFGWANGRKIWYGISVVIASILLAYGHAIVRRYGLKRIQEAFYGTNAWIGFVVLIGVILEMIQW